MKSLLTHLVGLSLCALIVGAAATRLKKIESPRGQNDKLAEALYMPTGEGLALLSFGFRNTLANLLWFRTISYFGRHYQTDQHYEWLEHLCDVVTDLDPGMKHVYEFGSLMLAWEMGDAHAANRLLGKGIVYNPDYWKLYYLRGFNSLYYLKDPKAAKNDLERSAMLPDSHLLLKLLAAKTLGEEDDDPNSALKFLESMLQQAKDPYEVDSLKRRIKETTIQRDLKVLSQAVSIYESRVGKRPSSIEQLVSEGIVAALPPDPFGGKYYLDPESGEPRSTSNVKVRSKKK